MELQTPPPDALSPDARAAVGDALGRIGRRLLKSPMRLRDFLIRAWDVVEPGHPFMGNWHIDLLCEYLEAVHLGQISRLIFNLPPRMTKSFSGVVAFPAWEWTEDPSIRFMFSGHNQTLCTKHSLDRRAVITSDWYKSQWGDLVRLAPDQNEKMRFQNTARGHMITAPVGGGATGLGGTRLCIDDLMNPERADSTLERERAIDFLDKTLMTRLDTADSAIILIEQRLARRDATGHLLAGASVEDQRATELIYNGWTRVKVPMEASRVMKYTFPRSGKVKEMLPGELLDPSRRDEKSITELRTRLGPHGTAAQLQQEPSDEDGSRFPRSYWRELPAIPDVIIRSLWSWDTATKKSQSNDFSVGGRIIRFAGGYAVLDIVRERLEYPALRREVRTCFSSAPTDLILVEDKSSGTQVQQELSTQDPDNPMQETLPVIVVPKEFTALEKSQRAALVEPQFAAGRVWLLKGGKWIPALKSEFAEFPSGDFDDQVDMLVNAIWYLMHEDIIDPQDDNQEPNDDESSSITGGL